MCKLQFTIQLFTSYCLPFILYVTEAVALTKYSARMLDNCVNQAVIKYVTWIV